jgi:hypothetical protein
MKFPEIVRESLALTQVFSASPICSLSHLSFASQFSPFSLRRAASLKPKSFSRSVTMWRGEKGRASRRDHKSYLNETKI